MSGRFGHEAWSERTNFRSKIVRAFGSDSCGAVFDSRLWAQTGPTRPLKPGSETTGEERRWKERNTNGKSKAKFIDYPTPLLSIKLETQNRVYESNRRG